MYNAPIREFVPIEWVCHIEMNERRERNLEAPFDLRGGIVRSTKRAGRQKISRDREPGRPGCKPPDYDATVRVKRKFTRLVPYRCTRCRRGAARAQTRRRRRSPVPPPR